ncbi:hypothetical protein, partial [Halorubellus sp. PRR65]|uniref:hypothetical protein n=1 Tax=Halorubellus sp. PRR65 TaxID=3098148 RepID=UPI002B2575C1
LEHINQVIVMDSAICESIVCSRQIKMTLFSFITESVVEYRLRVLRRKYFDSPVDSISALGFIE